MPTKKAKLTKAQIMAKLDELKVTYPKKAKLDELQSLLNSAKPKKARKVRVSTKSIIRAAFPNVGDKMPVDELIKHVTQTANCNPATVTTMIGDLKNTKYAAGPVINIKREDGNYVRHA